MTPCSARIRYAATRSSMWLIVFSSPMIRETRSSSVRLDARGRDHARPTRQFLLHQPAEALRRSAGRRHALFWEKIADLAEFEQYVHFRVAPCDARLRRPGRREHAIPCLHLEVGEAQLFERGYLGKRLRALRAHHGKHAELSALDVRGRRLQRHYHRLHVTPYQVGQCTARPLVGNVDEVDVRVELEQLHGEMLRTPVSGGGVVKLARLDAGEIEEFAHRSGRQSLRDDHRHGAVGEQYYRRKAPDRVERELLIDRGIGAEGGRGAKQRIAVGSSLGDEVGSYVARGARAVVGDDADLPAFAKFRSEDPCKDVGARARRIGNDHLDRAARPAALLRAGAGGEQENRPCLREIAQYPFTRWDHRRGGGHRPLTPPKQQISLKTPRLRRAETTPFF